jgi:hypothetical protein
MVVFFFPFSDAGTVFDVGTPLQFLLFEVGHEMVAWEHLSD